MAASRYDLTGLGCSLPVDLTAGLTEITYEQTL